MCAGRNLNRYDTLRTQLVHRNCSSVPYRGRCGSAFGLCYLILGFGSAVDHETWPGTAVAQVRSLKITPEIPRRVGCLCARGIVFNPSESKGEGGKNINNSSNQRRSTAVVGMMSVYAIVPAAVKLVSRWIFARN